MVKLSDILEKVTDISIKTLRKPTHVCISKFSADNITNQYKELCHSNADLVYSEDYNKITLSDVGDFLGVKILISEMNSYEFEILEEITSYTQ